MSQSLDHPITQTPNQASARPRLLIEDWLPITEIGIESLRERTPMTPFPAPNRLHVWFARRPLVASRAVVLASLLPADADRAKFLHILGIHGDPVAARERIAQATRDDVRLGAEAYGYKRAFTYSLDDADLACIREVSPRLGSESPPVVLDPTAGGGSIPLETIRLGFKSVANELNPVSWLILKATVELPLRHGTNLRTRFDELGREFVNRAKAKIAFLYPAEPAGFTCDGYLWARTVTCPYCGGLVPLSPNWMLDSEGTGVRLVPEIADPRNRRCCFGIVGQQSEQSKGTVKNGAAECPFPDCGRIIDSEEIKSQAQAGKMGQQLYTVVYKYQKVVGKIKSGKDKMKTVRGFRPPRPEDNVEALAVAKLQEKMPEWRARNVIPDEEIPPGHKTDEARRSGMMQWRDLFSPRQLYGHCTSVEVFQDLVEELGKTNGRELSDLDRAALVYIAIALDKVLNYNSIVSHWDSVRVAIRGKFDRHDFSFKWSFGEMASTVTGIGYDWAIEETGRTLGELIALVGAKNGKPPGLFQEPDHEGSVEVTLGSADALALTDGSIDCIVIDPPYYDNVMYAELSDFFYVWLKRTAGLLYPSAFVDHLTDKDREASANPAKFQDQKEGARKLAERDYHRRMAAIFRECRRVLKPEGAMTVMFTHKASGAWDALASALLEAGFMITASWPVNTEAEGSLHIKEKSAAKSTIFLVCRVREEKPRSDDLTYWEDVEPKVAKAVRDRVEKFQKAGIGGVDLYLACFGPALQVLSESWPLTRGRALQEDPRHRHRRIFEERDPYSVRPEDALDAARREVKNWRMAQLASVKRQHHLDALTEWYVLAWDAFRAPRFAADEALKLARVVGLDFDQHVKNTVCEVKGGNVLLWDSKTRRSKGKLGPVGEESMIDTLHLIALSAREQNTGVARDALERAKLLEDPTLMTALEALLNVLPAPSAGARKGEGLLTGAANDFVALEKLRRLAFAQQVPMPKAAEQLELTYS
jgi:adenine-specific DNA methylase